MENTITEKTKFGGISSFTLHLLAMAFMLCDHLWATVIPGCDWLTWVGRMAFPIFAFMIAEGFVHTHDLKKYMLRILAFALISELPFNLMTGGSLFYPYHQNVMWTFLLALICISIIDKVKKKDKLWLTVLTAVLVTAAALVVGLVCFVDYYGFGIATVIVFYLFRGRKWWQLLCQAAGLYWINCIMFGGLVVPVEIFGHTFEIVQQGAALLALIPIWLYRGRQGPHSRAIRCCFYAFYPVHILILAIVWLYL